MEAIPIPVAEALESAHEAAELDADDDRARRGASDADASRRIGLFITLEAPSKPMLPLLLMPTYQQAERIPAKQAAEQKELFG